MVNMLEMVAWTSWSMLALVQENRHCYEDENQ